MKNLSFNRRESNKTNKLLYEEIVDFICLHYNTNRTDSKFWQYMTENKSEWVKMFDEKCRNEFLQTTNITTKFWDVESYIQVANGLKMFNKDSIKEYVMSLENYEDILDDCRSLDTEIRKAKELNSNVSQKDMFKFFTPMNNFIQQIEVLSREELKTVNEYIDTLDFQPNKIL